MSVHLTIPASVCCVENLSTCCVGSVPTGSAVTLTGVSALLQQITQSNKQRYSGVAILLRLCFPSTVHPNPLRGVSADVRFNNFCEFLCINNKIFLFHMCLF